MIKNVIDIPRTKDQIIYELRGQLALSENLVKALTELLSERQKRVNDLETTIEDLNKLIERARYGKSFTSPNSEFLQKRVNSGRDSETC